MSLHSEIIQGLEALPGWSGQVKVVVARPPQGTISAYAIVMPQPTPQPESTQGQHPTYTFSKFSIGVTTHSQLTAMALAEEAWGWIRDFTGKITVSSSRFVEAADAPESPTALFSETPDGSEALLHSASFDVQLIHRAA